MFIKNILIITGEPKSIFLEVLFKYIKSKKFKLNKKKLILIGNHELIFQEMHRLNYKFKINKIFKVNEAISKKINLIDIEIKDIKKKKLRNFESKQYISNCFKKAFSILKENKNSVLFNGPINKEKFLKKKFLGLTEYVANKTKTKHPVMLIYNKKISVSPVTTHLPIKYIVKNLTKFKIINNVKSINSFYVKKFEKKPKIAVLGLNPHCETTENIGEEQKIIIPAIKEIKKNSININGPFSADTFFIKKNIDYYDVVIGMYHDQVLTPLKTLYNFNAINITIGLPFIRVSPDHGPNISMYGKNKSDPSSIFCAMDFFNKI